MEKGLMRRESEEEAVWDPFRDLGTLPAIGSLLDELLTPMRLPSTPKAWLPRVDVQETEKEYVLTAALPGVRKEDVKLDVRDGVLTIAGERRAEKEEKGKAWLRRETTYGSFSRSFTLPEGTHPEDIKASHKDGVLTVSMPKPAEPKSKSVRIGVD